MQISFESDKSVEDSALCSSSHSKRKGRGKNLDWTLLKNFNTEIEARTFLKSEKIWAQTFTNHCYNGEKVHHRCKLVPRKGQQCKAKLFLFKSDTSMRVEIYTSGEHTHAGIAVKAIRNGEIKLTILALGKTGTKPAAILKYLKERYPENDVPRITSIRNLLNRASPTQNAGSIVSIGNINEWAEAKHTIPEDETTAFVLNYDSSESEAESKYFRFIMSSKLMLQNATKSDIIQIDATYKLIWNGFPVFVLGTTDKKKKFHLIAIGVSTNEKQEDFEFMMSSLKTSVEVIIKKIYMPTVLISDAAPAITNAFDSIFMNGKKTKVMCYYHVVSNLKKQKLADNSTENWEKIKSDVNYLHLAPSEPAFSKACKLFVEKNRREKNFCEYFQRIWVEKNCNWFEGIKHFTPSTNNGVEAFNSVLKRDYSYRRRLSVAAFTNLMTEIIETISIKYREGEKKIGTEQEMSIEDWRNGCEWIKLKRTMFEVESEKGYHKIYIPSNTFAKNHNGQAFGATHINKYVSRSWKTFEQYKKVAFSLYMVNFCSENWKASTCTCSSFFKNYKCKHITGLAISKKIVKPPKSANVDTIGKKCKKGRKPNAVKALLIN